MHPETIEIEKHKKRRPWLFFVVKKVMQNYPPSYPQILAASHSLIKRKSKRTPAPNANPPGPKRPAIKIKEQAVASYTRSLI